MKLLKPIIYLLIIGVLFYLLTKKTAPSLTDPIKMVETPGVYTSMPYDNFRQLLPKRFDYIKNKSSFLTPYDKDKLALIENNIGKVTDEQMVAQLYMAPNASVGLYRLESIPVGPEQVTSFQFEQGQLGWFWFYGTFIDSSGKTASYMYYVNRVDLYPPDLRKEMNLPMGSTTYYSISMGVGRGGEWEYAPYKFCRGEYTIKNDSVYSFKGIDLPNGWNISFSTERKGEFKIAAGWKTNDSAKQQGLNMTVKAERLPFYNSASNDGCSPCVGGSGTLYLSYTQMKSNGTITLNDSTAGYADGTSWLDRQWANSQISTPYIALLNNSMSMFKDRVEGLGKYIWLNLHLGKDLQYMVFNFFPLSEKVTKGTTFTSMQIRYGKDKPEFGLTAPAEVMETKILDGVEYPLKYKLQTKDGTYILDASKFDKSRCIDISNNIHWDGSGIIYDTTGKMVGTGFLEANQFADPNSYVVNQLKSMGLDTTEQNKAFFKEEGKMPVSQGLPSLIITILFVVLFIFLVVLLFKSFKHIKASV